MLSVKTKIGKSDVHGIGLFADQFIAMGTIIYNEDKYTINITLDEYSKLNDISKNFFDTYSYMNSGVYKCSLDNDRFMNHSDNPNTIDISDKTIARFDINKGDEITCNYNDLGIVKLM